MKNYEKLDVVKVARELVDRIYKIKLPKYEDYALKSQLIRATTSILFNIAEGYGRGRQKEIVRFLIIAKGSAYEVYEQLQTIERVYDYDLSSEKELVDRIIRMLSGLIKFNGNRQSATE